MRILVCGSRKWRNKEIVKEVLNEFPNKTLLIHGDCRGADKIAGKAGLKRGMVVEPVPADWDRYGKRAGPIRNRWMLSRKPDVVIAFCDDIQKSRGTSDMVCAAIDWGYVVRLYDSRGTLTQLASTPPLLQ